MFVDVFTLPIATLNQTSDTLFTIRYVVITVIFIYLLWMFSRMISKKNFSALKDKNIKILDRVSLSTDKNILLIELENVFYLIGVDKNGMYLIDKRDDIDLNRYFKETESDNGSLFSSKLKEALKKKDTDSNDK